MTNETNIQTQVDKTWTLFLDRDGVINEENIGSYITDWDDFNFCDGTLEAMTTLSDIFGRVVVVTNQRGVGKGIMTLEDMKRIHINMIKQVQEEGGRVDKVYACTAVEDDDHNRKPNIGMAYQAQQDFDDIDFKRCIMVGNALTDMEFGKKAGMHTVFLTTRHEPYELPNDLIDEQFGSLQSWAKSLVTEPVE